MINENSMEWKIIAEYLEDKLLTLREQNDKVNPPDATNFIRGQIKATKDLLNLPSVSVLPDSTPVKYID